MKKMIDKTFGTVRGLARLALGYLELALGRTRPFHPPKPETVARLVFVCQGNICRSAYGAKIAAGLGLPVASLGLSTTTGASSPLEAVAAAHRQGVDLTAHRALDWSDFKPLPGDLLLVMEIRQAHEIKRRLNGRNDIGVALLGMWCSPVMPHLHDPFTLSPGYFDTCFRRVDEAVRNIAATMRFKPASQSTT